MECVGLMSSLQPVDQSQRPTLEGLRPVAASCDQVTPRDAYESRDVMRWSSFSIATLNESDLMARTKHTKKKNSGSSLERATKSPAKPLPKELVKSAKRKRDLSILHKILYPKEQHATSHGHPTPHGSPCPSPRNFVTNTCHTIESQRRPPKGRYLRRSLVQANLLS